MTDPHFSYRLYLVVSGEHCRGRDPVEVTEAAVRGGVDLVQLREKELPAPEFLNRALRLQEMLHSYKVPLIINDCLEVAMQAGARGIHVGNHDLPPAAVRASWPDCGMLGYSVEYPEQLSNEQTPMADYLGISPVFRTPTKRDTVTEWGLHGIRTLRALTGKPLVAIGNMNAANAGSVIRAGADCIAVVSAICASDDPARSAFNIRNAIEKAG